MTHGNASSFQLDDLQEGKPYPTGYFTDYLNTITHSPGLF